VAQQDALVRYVRDALSHLYDRSYLRAHPLGDLLGQSSQVAGDELRTRLLETIEQLRPPEPCPPDSPAWRPFRYLMLRYVEGAKAERIASELQVSVRQSQREHDRALDQLASLLREHLSEKARGQRLAPPPTSLARVGQGPERASSASQPGVSPNVDTTDLLRVGALPPDEPTSLSDVLADAKSIVEDLVRLRGATVDVELGPALPLVRANRLVLRQVLIDLLSFAVETRIAAVVRVAATAADDSVLVEVTVPGDTTDQVPTEIEARLSAIHTLVELQHGSLVTDSPRGFAFVALLRLPRSRVVTLLVVDDNPDVAYMFGRFLEGYESEVLHAATGPAALRLARENHPDALTLDVLMPSQDGWDILRDLRGDPTTREIPIILCSVLPERALALSLGVREFLDKPVTRQTLLDALERCVPALAARSAA
jgi:CheY-like chemotaxis protein